MSNHSLYCRCATCRDNRQGAYSVAAAIANAPFDLAREYTQHRQASMRRQPPIVPSGHEAIHDPGPQLVPTGLTIYVGAFIDPAIYVVTYAENYPHYGPSPIEPLYREWLQSENPHARRFTFPHPGSPEEDEAARTKMHECIRRRGEEITRNREAAIKEILGL